MNAAALVLALVAEGGPEATLNEDDTVPIKSGDAAQRRTPQLDPSEGGLMLTPDEIRVKEFITTLRGYDTDEVRSFLDQVAASLEAERRATAVAPVMDTGELVTKVTRLTEELELALWTMRRLEATVNRLEDRLDRMGDPSLPAG